MAIYYLSEEHFFPDPAQAEPEGLLAIGGGLEPERLLLAYRLGIFPWYSKGQPILWWSPDPRLVLFPEDFKISKSLKRVLKKDQFEIRFDSDFMGTIQYCAKTKRKGQEGTWITQEMIDAYLALFDLGYAHSIETYFENKLVGGLYGLSIGKAFFGESMFSLQPDASKVAMAKLVERSKQWGFDFIDCQVPTEHLKSLGGHEISREEFLKRLKESLKAPTYSGNWSDENLRSKFDCFEQNEQMERFFIKRQPYSF